MSKNKNMEMPELLGNEAVSDAPVMTDEELAAYRKKKKKRGMITFVSLLLVICISGGALLLLKPWAKTGLGETLGMYGSNKSYNHYPAEYDLDVTTVEEYMELDRNIYYVRGGERLILEEMGELTPDQQFFVGYFDCAINGRYEEYNAMFTDKYYEDNEPYVRFAPQMIYDISIEKLSESYSDGATNYTYNVTYRIYRNNGTFRNDIGSNGAKTLFFSLLESGGEIKIDRITYYV